MRNSPFISIYPVKKQNRCGTGEHFYFYIVPAGAVNSVAPVSQQGMELDERDNHACTFVLVGRSMFVLDFLKVKSSMHGL